MFVDDDDNDDENFLNIKKIFIGGVNKTWK